MPRVFVYGSLLAGLHNHRVLAGARYAGRAVTVQHYVMVSLGGYPGAWQGGDAALRGEVYMVDDSTLARLDQLEGHPRFYRRRRAKLPDGSCAWIYLLVDYGQYQLRQRVPDGDWRRFAEEHHAY